MASPTPRGTNRTLVQIQLPWR